MIIILNDKVVYNKHKMNDFSKFQKVYANLPDKIRDGIVVVINDKPYSWNAVYVELINNTKLGQEMYHKLIEMEII